MKTDSEIQKDVMEELKWEPQVDATEIGVAVKNGIVTLSGQVYTYAQKKAAERAAARVKEVKAIAEDIIVHISSLHEKTDKDIAESVIFSLKWDTTIPQDAIKVTVENGWVTLDGEVTWEYQKRAAESVIEKKPGVKGVFNHLKIHPHVLTPVVKDVIRKALERSADVEANKISVAVEGSTVTLTGDVRSWRERDDIARAAWNAPGVVRVDNKLVVA